MKKKIGVVIGASGDAVHSIQMAQKNGIYVIGLDGNSEAEGLRYVDEIRIIDISDEDKVSAVIDEIAPDFVIPVPIGRYLSTMGVINDMFRLNGATGRATKFSTDKYLFHGELKKAGLRNIDAFLINRSTEYDIIKDIKFPALFKPRYGSGSRDIFYVNNQEELKKFFWMTVKKKEDFILEQAVEGTEYSVDGAVIEGKMYITLLREKIITPIPVRQPISSFSVIISEENKALFNRVYKHIESAAKVLNYDNCLLNADLIVNENEVFLIEMAPRPSGHNLHDIFVPLATGIDLSEEYIYFLLQKRYNFQPSLIRRLQIRFFDFEDVIITKVPQIEEIQNSDYCNLVLWNCNILNGDVMNKVTNGHSIMGRGFFIVEGDSKEDLIAQSEWILSQFEYARI